MSVGAPLDATRLHNDLNQFREATPDWHWQPWYATLRTVFIGLSFSSGQTVAQSQARGTRHEALNFAYICICTCMWQGGGCGVVWIWISIDWNRCCCGSWAKENAAIKTNARCPMKLETSQSTQGPCTVGVMCGNCNDLLYTIVRNFIFVHPL